MVVHAMRGLSSLRRLAATSGGLRYESEQAAGATLASLRERLANGPDLDDFIRGGQDGGGKYSVQAPVKEGRTRKPDWLRQTVPGGDNYRRIKSKVRELGLSTVCEEAKCPNIGECWGGGDGTATATIMIMGDTCTRACRFCAVKTSKAPPALDPEEPRKVGEAVSEWGLDYVVFTSVDRDDVHDLGSGHMAKTVEEVKRRSPDMLVEVLAPDFQGDPELVGHLASSGLDVFAHNVETVENLQKHVRDRRAGWHQSLSVLDEAKRKGAPVTKTSLMLGVGETVDEIRDALRQLRDVDCDVVTLGQYMRPTKKHMPVAEFVTPDAFERWRQAAEAMGFKYAAAGPLVRSSYRAGEYYISRLLKGNISNARPAAPAHASSSA